MISIVSRHLVTRLGAGSLSRNGLFALGQSLVVLVCMFIAYRLVIVYAGLERFGLWSLLLAGSALARMGDISGGGALARFVASAGHHKDPKRVRNVVHTVLLTSLALNVAIGFVVWVAAPLALPLFISPQYLHEAESLVPYVVGSLVLGTLALALTSGIDGTQRADQRAIIVSAASLTFLATCAVLVPRQGVIGFGFAHVVQQMVMVILGWLVLRWHVPDLGWLPIHWRRGVFFETTGYALKLNGIGIMSLLFDPMAKFVFNHAGGPSLVALYELASRLAMQIRGLLVTAALPLVPAFAAYLSPNDPDFRTLLEKSSKVMAVSSVMAALAALAAAPLMSFIVLGHLSRGLLLMNAALIAGWSINVICVPFYFVAQAFGSLRWNFASHAIIAVSMLVAAIVTVPLWGTSGLVASIVVGLGLGTVTVLLGNAHLFGLMDMLWRLRLWLIGSGIAIALLSGAGGAIAARYTA